MHMFHTHTDVQKKTECIHGVTVVVVVVVVVAVSTPSASTQKASTQSQCVELVHRDPVRSCQRCRCTCSTPKLLFKRKTSMPSEDYEKAIAARSRGQVNLNNLNNLNNLGPRERAV